MTFFRKQFSFSIFYLYLLSDMISHDLIYNIYHSFLDTKNVYFTQKITFFPFVISYASNNTRSPNIGRTDAWAVPHLKFWGTVPPVLPIVSTYASSPLNNCNLFINMALETYSGSLNHSPGG